MTNSIKKVKKLGLALGSGGMRGSCHLGFLQVLEEYGIRPDYIAGCSMGAVVGGCYAASGDLEGMERIVRAMRTASLVHFNMFTPTANLGVISGKRIEHLLSSFAGGKQIQELEIPFACVAVDLISGKEHIFREGDLITAIRASSSVPIVFEPVEVDGKLFVDGGIINRVPSNLVREMGAEVVVAVDALAGLIDERRPKTATALLLRTMDIMEAHIASKHTTDADLYIEPEQCGLTRHRVKDMVQSMECGRAAAEQNIQKIIELIT